MEPIASFSIDFCKPYNSIVNFFKHYFSEYDKISERLCRLNHTQENIESYLQEYPNLRSLMGGRNDRNKRSSASNRPRTQIQDMTYKKYALQSKGS
jgi:hypothetical protein